MKIISNFELPISKENEALIQIIATGLGYKGEWNPDDYIEKFFNDFYDNVRITTESSLNKYFGEAGKEIIKSILNQYDAEVIKNITIEYDTN